EVLGREEYKAVLNRWKRIRGIEVSLKVHDGQPTAFLPDGDDAIAESRTRMTFKRGVLVSRAVNTIKSLWQRPRNKDEETLKVDGVDEWGFNRKVELEEEIPSLFGELDHDTVIADSTSFAPDLANSYVIKYLKRIIRDAPRIFG